MKRALNTREPTVIIRVLKAIQQMVTEGRYHDCVHILRHIAFIPQHGCLLNVNNQFETDHNKHNFKAQSILLLHANPLIYRFRSSSSTLPINIITAVHGTWTPGPCVGQALVPYYRQILPICNLFRDVNVNLGEGIDFKRDTRLGDVIEDTLQILEKYGGPDAYINIKYMVPTYESCVMN